MSPGRTSPRSELPMRQMVPFALLAINPRVKALVSSGSANDAIMADSGAYGFKGVITKPCGLKNFNQTLQSVLRA